MWQDLSTLQLVRVGSTPPEGLFRQLRDALSDAFLGVIHNLSDHEHTPPPVQRIEASLLTSDLDDALGGHVLGVTAADLVDSHGDDFFPFMFGGKDHRNHVAVVSTRRLHSQDPQVTRDRVAKVALHEVGHNFGLTHHYDFVRASDGGYCPMSKGQYNRYGERGYVRSVIDGRGFRFCGGCLSFLERVYAQAQAQTPVPRESGHQT